MPLQFAALLKRLLAERKLSGRGFSKIIGRSSGYLTDVLKGRRAPADDVEVWADALKISGTERREFLLAAAWTRTPQVMRDHVAELERRVQRVDVGNRKR